MHTMFGRYLDIFAPLTICCFIICFVTLCCLCCKRCRKRGNQNVNTTFVYTPPQQPLPPSGYQPCYPGFQPVPVYGGYGGPPITAGPPPSYSEAVFSGDPPLFPAASGPPQPMYPYPYPGPPYAPPPPRSDELAQPAYNPAYGPVP